MTNYNKHNTTGPYDRRQERETSAYVKESMEEDTDANYSFQPIPGRIEEVKERNKKRSNLEEKVEE